jgi:alkylation response protein AidB-like acyl-CoA dehydrogenase
MLPADVGGSGLGPRTFAAIVSALAEADASVAMVYLMHVCAAATIAAARKDATVAPTLKEIGAGRHLSTLAFSEAGSRSHFWAPVSRARRNAAGVHITAKKSFVTSAGQASSYVVSALAPQGTAPTDSTLYLIPSGARGLSVAGAWDGLGLRANASAPMTLDDCEVSYESQLTDDGAGFQAMLQVVLPLFNLGSAAVALVFAARQWRAPRPTSRALGSSIWVRASAKACRLCARRSQRCRSTLMVSPHVSMI